MLNREQLKQWIDRGPANCIDELCAMGASQIADLRALADAVLPQPKTDPEPKRQRKPRSRRPDCVLAPNPPEAAAPVALLLGREPRRPYTASSIGLALGMPPVEVAAQLRELQRTGKARCTGRGRAALWAWVPETAAAAPADRESGPVELPPPATEQDEAEELAS